MKQKEKFSGFSLGPFNISSLGLFSMSAASYNLKKNFIFGGKVRVAHSYFIEEKKTAAFLN